jgi:cytochrome c oxidase subunit 2
MITMNVSNTFGRLARCGIDRSALVLICRRGWLPAHAVTDLPGVPPSISSISSCRDQGCRAGLVVVSYAGDLFGDFLGRFGVMFYSIWKHRKSVGHKSANFHESTAVEIAWTVVPFPSSLVWLFCHQSRGCEKDTSSADLTIKVTGMRKWGIRLHQG